MRFLKLLLTGVMCAGMALGWTNRALVLDAYREDPEPLDFSLDGLDFEVDTASRSASPFSVPRAPDTRDISLAVGSVAPSPEAASASLGGGSAVITGVVSGPAGAAAGVTVLLERHTLSGSASTQVTTDIDGHWSVTGLQGGRFRVRAFLPGVLASSGAEVFFLDAGARSQLNLSVVEAQQAPIVSFTGPETLEVGAEHTVAVSVGFEAVDGDGRLVTLPRQGLTLVAVASGSVELLSADQVTTDGFGAARFRVRCSQPAQNVLTVDVDGQFFGFAFPPCVHRPLGETAPDAGSGQPDGGDTDG